MSTRRRSRVGVLDNESIRLGGSQHVVARIAACLSERYDVEIIHSGKGYSLTELGRAFGLDLNGVTERVEESAHDDFSFPGQRATLPTLATAFGRQRRLTAPYDLFIYSGHGTPPMCGAGRGIVYCHFPYTARPGLAFEDHPRFARHGRLGRGARMALYRRVWRRRMRGYPIVLANSGFSAGHVERAWGRRADVVPPPVAGAPAVHPKRNRVVSLGRFIATDRKRLRAQLRALPRFLEHTDGSWALDMVGFCSDFDEDREFLDELRARSATLPVNFVVNAPRAAVDEALVGAKLFWHTAGLPDGEDVPARYQEHFGIATVEAMRAGCVPVVPDAGGQPEIVQHGIHGYLCRDVDYLVRHSVTVAGDERLRDRMSRAARTRSLEFAPELFDQRIRAHVEAALHRGSG